jgi:hypothetical protein
MREAESKTIDGHKYRCQMMSVRSAHQTFLNLCNTIGEPVVKAIADGAADMEGDAIRLIVMAITAAAQNLEGGPGDRLIESVFNGVSYLDEETDAKPGFALKAWDEDFERHFKGHLFSMYKVWAWSVEVNYRDFLEGAQGLGGDKTVGLVKQGLNFLQTPTSASGPSSSTSS